MGLRTRVEVACRAARRSAQTFLPDTWTSKVEGTDFSVQAALLSKGRTSYVLLKSGGYGLPEVRSTRVAEFGREVVHRFGKERS